MSQGTDLVLNLAAGLDARPYRMTLPAGFRWVEVDLPHLVTYKQDILAKEKPVCSLERVSLDLSDRKKRRELFARLGSEAKRALVLSEGLLVYLTAEENAELAEDLAAQPSFAHWLFDLASPMLLAYLQQTSGQHTDKAGAPLKFGPAQGPEFFESHGWRDREDPIDVCCGRRDEPRAPGTPGIRSFSRTAEALDHAGTLVGRVSDDKGAERSHGHPAVGQW